MALGEPPWDGLDPGIRGAVRMFWEAGFRTMADSGDGEHKGTLGWPEDEWTPYPHVVFIVARCCEVEPLTAPIVETLGSRGLQVGPQGPDDGTDPEVWVQASWSPGGDWAIFVAGSGLFNLGGEDKP